MAMSTETAAAPNQSLGPESDTPTKMAHQYLPVLITLILLICFFVGFLTMFFFRCITAYIAGATGFFRRSSNGTAKPNAGPGLDPTIISSFPIFIYSKVKDLRQEKNGLECAVCLAEFQDEDELKLITGCNHAFHPDCIHLWFEAHTTCPVCRRNLDPSFESKPSGDDHHLHEVAEAIPAQSDQRDHQEMTREDALSRGRSVTDDDHGGRHDEDLRFDNNNNDNINSHHVIVVEGRVHGIRFMEGRERLGRSHSTGHSIQLRNNNRFTLSLPEHMEEGILRGHNWTGSCIPLGDYTGEVSTSGFSGRDHNSRV